MKNIVIYFNDFDPINIANISLIDSLKDKIENVDIYLGLTKKSKKDNLSPFLVRKNILRNYIKLANDNLKYTNITLDFNNLDDSLIKLINKFGSNNHYYLVIEYKDFIELQNSSNYNELKKICSLILTDDSTLKIESHILLTKSIEIVKIPLIDTNALINNDYTYIDKITKDYIINNNIYLKKQIRPYLTLKRYNHSISVANTALLINKEGRLGLDPNKVERAGLLHDIAKYLNKDITNSLMHKYYPEYENEDYKILHQYIGEYIARVNFNETDSDILNAIKYHTTGRKKMSLMEKLIYVSDKIEPTREYETQSKIDLCIKDFNQGFLLVLNSNRDYLLSKTTITNKDTLECFKYYLKKGSK